MSKQGTKAGIHDEVGRYYLLQAATIVGGLVSMPITTRLLSQFEYGVLSLTFATVSLGTVVGQLGFANAIARFYAERELVSAGAARHFSEVVFTGALASALLVTVVLGLVLGGVLGWSPGDSPKILALAAIIVVLRVLLTVLVSIYRSRLEVGAFAAVKLACQWGILVVALSLLLWKPAAITVLATTVFVEGLVLVVCLLEMRRRGLLRRPAWSWPLLKAANEYGWPLAFAGAAALVTSYADRFLIEHFLGTGAVAEYSIPYDLSSEVARALLLPVQTAVLPAIFRLWAAGRESEVRTSLSALTTNMLAVALPIAALFIALSDEIITALASDKYRASAALTVYLVPGVLLNEMSFLFAVGLRLSRETRAAALIALGGAAANIAINVVCLPRFGLPGAAVATTLTYGGMIVALYLWSRPVLRLHIRVGLLLKSCAATALMLAAVLGAGPVTSWLPLDVAVRGGAGVLIASACLLAIDSRLRSTLRNAIATRGAA
jgi:O-antigen/teichoic acid export membrane protein